MVRLIGSIRSRAGVVAVVTGGVSMPGQHADVAKRHDELAADRRKLNALADQLLRVTFDRACMQPPRRATPRHMDVRRIAIMDQLPGRDAGCLWARQVCHVAASSLCDLVRRMVVPNLTWEPSAYVAKSSDN